MSITNDTAVLLMQGFVTLAELGSVMKKEQLPVFQIQDFELQTPRKPDFYLNKFSRHLDKHQFIQKPHKHDFYIVLFVSSGTGTHTIDFVSYAVRPGSVFFLSPGQVHSWELSTHSEGFICFFSPEFYKSGFPDRKLVEYPFFNPLLKPILQLPEQEALNIQNLFLQMDSELKSVDWRNQEVILNLLDILFILMTRSYQQQNNVELPTAGHYSLLLQLESLIENNYKKHLPVDFYADLLNITPKQLNSNCKESLGKTTSDLIQNRIILEAKRLLIHSDLTITQIAAELGYFDNSYFTRFYKKKTGQTPEAFRKDSVRI